ncbi:MAG TPA: PD-(D/E)XK nuclease family protein, partial [Steroidobacteraceae bacterium]|nr:PD-(D/E)XK nuclease family protein [Steroidobacteraceae bacterium]
PYTTATTLSIPHLMHASRIVEAFEDGMGEPWQQGRPLPGGTRSIEHQIRCAFRAYAELRLEALPLEPPRPGLDRRDRGRLVHRALELVWNELRDSVRLAAGRGPALGRLIGRAVERAVGDLLAENPGEGRERALRREQRRVARLVAELCELEGRRAPFAVVRSETNRTLRFEGATLHVRIDRIDRLDDGTLALLDYKTGGPQTQDWLGERPSHPQLLVYLLAVDGEVSAVATAHLATGRVSFRGIADRDGRLPKVAGLQAAAWPRQLEAWRMLVEQAVRDFLGGRAVRDPIEGACTHCHLHAVCRIGDATAWGGDER